MAQRRMCKIGVIDSDAFLDLPKESQLLYFHLLMRADDEGFLNNAKGLARMLEISPNSLLVLFKKKFIIGFESGVVVIKHWLMHNHISASRITKTTYNEERAMLVVKENNSYSLNKEYLQDVFIDSEGELYESVDDFQKITGIEVQNVDDMYTRCIQSADKISTECMQDDNKMSTKCLLNVYNMSTQVRLGKVSLGKVKYTLAHSEFNTSDKIVIDKDSKDIQKSKINKNDKIVIDKPRGKKVKKTESNNFAIFWEVYPRKNSKEQARKKFSELEKKKLLPPISKLVEIVKEHIQSEQWKEEGGKYIPYPGTWLNKHGWEDVIRNNCKSDGISDFFKKNTKIKKEGKEVIDVQIEET